MMFVTKGIGLPSVTHDRLCFPVTRNSDTF